MAEIHLWGALRPAADGAPVVSVDAKTIRELFRKLGRESEANAHLAAALRLTVAALDDADSNVRGAVAWALGRWLAGEGACAGLAAAALNARLRLETDADVRREIEGALHGSARRPRDPSGEQ